MSDGADILRAIGITPPADRKPEPEPAPPPVADTQPADTLDGDLLAQAAAHRSRSRDALIAALTRPQETDQ